MVARAGSKGVPGKNLAPIAGRACVVWTIDQARRAAAVGEVVVSSDSADILALAAAMGATPHRRSDALATDSARVDDALREAVLWREGQPPSHARGAEERVGGVVLLYGNVPVRPEGLVDRAVGLWRASGCDSVQSYAAAGKYHPLWQVRVDDAGRVTPWEGDRLFGGVYRRQELSPSYVPDGGVLVVSRAALFHELEGADPAHPHSFLGCDHRGVMTAEGDVVDIDSAVDLAVAEAVLCRRVATVGG